jgi:hypothetical protein
MKKTAVFVMTLIGILFAGARIFPESADTVPEFAEWLELGESATYRNLTVVPVYFRKAKPTEDASYLTLDQALEEGVLEIREKDGGDVPWVVVSNRNDKRIFIMGGEILSGCRQDRIVARDVLIAPYRKRLLLPVYCVEAGRWHHVSGEFKSEKNLGTYTMRGAAQSLSGNNQMEIWNKVAESNRKMGVSSDTEAYQDAFRTEEVAKLVSDVEQKFKDLPLLENETVGVVIGLGDQIIGVDIFSDPDLFRELWPKIIRSCVLAMVGYEQKTTLSRDRVVQFLNGLQRMHYGQRRGVDLGFEYSGDLKELSVSSLVYRDTVFHLGALAPDETSERRLSELSVEQSLPSLLFQEHNSRQSRR